MKSVIKSAGLIVFLAIVSVAASARSGSAADRSQTNHDIWIQPGETAGSLSCLNCSVHVRGEVAGDVAAVHGNVMVESGGAVTGDVAAVLGNVQVENNGRINGDVAAVGGKIRRASQATIAGDQAAIPTILLLLLALIPLALLGLLIALIVWLVHRNRHPVPSTA